MDFFLLTALSWESHFIILGAFVRVVYDTLSQFI